MRPMLNNYDLINEGLSELTITNEEAKTERFLDLLNDSTIGWRNAEKIPTGKLAFPHIEKALKNPLRCHKCSEIFAIDLSLTPVWFRNTVRDRSEEIRAFEARGFKFMAQRAATTQHGEGLCHACYDDEQSLQYFSKECYSLNESLCCYEASHGYPCGCSAEELLDENDMETWNERENRLWCEQDTTNLSDPCHETECERQWRLTYMADMVHEGVESEENYHNAVRR